MNFDIDPREINLQGPDGMQLVKLLRKLIAAEDGGGGGGDEPVPTETEELFICTYGETLFADIKQAVTDGKLPVCNRNDQWYYMCEITTGVCTFFNFRYSSNTANFLFCRTSGWSYATYLEQERLQFDYSPTEGSTNPVTSGGVYTALQNAGGSDIDPYQQYPAMDGVASPGSSDDYARGDHVHPTDTSRAAVSDIPTKVSDLQNDSGFVNQNQAAAAAPVQSVNGQTGAVTVQPASDAQVSAAANAWLGANVAQETGYALDNSLTMKNAAAPADKVGTLKDALFNLNIKYYFDHQIVNTNTNMEAEISKPNVGTIGVIIRNGSANDAYANIKQYDANNDQVSDFTRLIAAGATLAVSDFEIIDAATKIVIRNPSGVNYLVYTVYLSILDAVTETIDTVNTEIFAETPTVRIGYLNSSGGLAPQNSGTNRYTDALPAQYGEEFSYSGSYAGWSVVFGYYSDNTAVSLLPAGTYENKVIKITDQNIVKVRAWSDISRQELKFISLKSIQAQVEQIKGTMPNNYGTIIVDSSGNGDFTDLKSAITYAKSTYDVAAYPVEIYIKDGIYAVTPTATDPYYAVDKGANKISIRGQSRDGTIIRCTCTSELQGIALNIGGECTIENLTIENLADTSFTSETILEGNHRPYCIHCDTPFVGNTKHYYTTVKNVKLYSECMCPFGAGLQDLQTIRLENVEVVFASNAVMAEQGAVYIHAPYSSAFTADGVQLVDCVMISENARPALVLPDVSGSQSMADVEQTFVRNVTASRGANEVWMSAPNNKSFWSKSNSNAALNA